MDLTRMIDKALYSLRSGSVSIQKYINSRSTMEKTNSNKVDEMVVPEYMTPLNLVSSRYFLIQWAAPGPINTKSSIPEAFISALYLSCRERQINWRSHLARKRRTCSFTTARTKSRHTYHPKWREKCTITLEKRSDFVSGSREPVKRTRTKEGRWNNGRRVVELGDWVSISRNEGRNRNRYFLPLTMDENSYSFSSSPKILIPSTSAQGKV